jgi:hypothetical protein
MSDESDMDAEYSRVSTKLKRKRTKDSKGSRSYPGYEDYSPKGRAQIKAFNEAGGPEFLNDDTDAEEYKAAAQHGLDARRKSGTKQESMRGKPKKTVLDAVDDGIKRAKRDE